VHESDVTNMKSTQAQTATCADATNNLLSLIHSFITSLARTCTHAQIFNITQLM